MTEVPLLRLENFLSQVRDKFVPEVVLLMLKSEV